MQTAASFRKHEMALANLQAGVAKTMQRLLSAMKTMCVFRVNGVCWQDCQAREFCQPETDRLLTVRDLREVGHD